MLSPATVAILFGVGLVILGPKKLPELGRALGQGLGNFKKALQDAQNEVKSATDTEAKPLPGKSDEPGDGASAKEPSGKE